MNHTELQVELKLRGNYHGQIDGDFGPASQAGLRQALKEGIDRKLSPEVIKLIARGNNLPQSRIYAVRTVEAAGNGFSDATGQQLVLHEGHWFSKLTKGKFDNSHPTISYPKWDKSKYPASQAARWDQIIEAVSLDVDAGFSSASHGLFQIMGGNYELCGFKRPWDFVMAMSLSEDAQIEAFLAFITNKKIHGYNLLHWLREGRWDYFAEGYNGSAYRANQYDTKLLAADKANWKYN